MILGKEIGPHELSSQLADSEMNREVKSIWDGKVFASFQIVINLWDHEIKDKESVLKLVRFLGS